MVKRSMLIWLAIIPLAVLNGALREMVLIPAIGIGWAQPTSGILLCAIIFILCLIFIPRLGRASGKTYFLIGLVWMAATVVFETAFGLASGETFGNIMKAYDITSGNLWSAVVLFTGIAPWLAAKTRKMI